MRTLAQKRAGFALDRVVKAVGKKSLQEKKDFKSVTSGAPSMILQNGLGQSLAFWLNKGTSDGKIKEDSKYIVLFDIVKDWLTFRDGDINNKFASAKGRRELIMELSTMTQMDYLEAQNETLALLEWVKRFAAADLE